MYGSIKEEILKAKEDQQSIIIGNFNAKIDNGIKGNMQAVTEGVRQLIKMIDKYNMKIVNKQEQEIC